MINYILECTAPTKSEAEKKISGITRNGDE